MAVSTADATMHSPQAIRPREGMGQTLITGENIDVSPPSPAKENEGDRQEEIHQRGAVPPAPPLVNIQGKDSLARAPSTGSARLGAIPLKR